MNCLVIASYRLHDYLDKGLPNEEMCEIRDHCATCAVCQERSRELQLLLDELRALPATGELKRDLWPAIAAQMQKPDHLLKQLSEAIALRRVRLASSLARNQIDRIVDLDPSQPNAAALLSYFTQWMEMGAAHSPVMPYPSYLALAAECLKRFPGPPRPAFQVSELAHLHVVAGILAMRGEEYDAAISHFHFVLAVKDELGDSDLIALAQGSIGQAYTKKGIYVEASRFIDKAIATALASGRDEMAGVLKIRKGWILFQRNERKEAIRVLAEAEAVLQQTDDHLTLGNIKAAIGRIARHDGRYDDALHSYDRAIKHYKECDPSAQHPNFARALVNMALLKRLIAQRICNGQRFSAEQRVAEASPSTNGHTVKLSEPVRELRQQACEYLGQAASIYERQQDHRGRGSVLLISASLHADSGDLSSAATELVRAYELGRKKSDHILMVRSRIQQCIVENALSETDGDGTVSYSHAERARTFAEDAVSSGEKNTPHYIRLIAHAYIWLGITLLNPYISDSHEGQGCLQRAEGLLQGHEADGYYPKSATRDYIWDDLKLLRQRLGPLDEQYSMQGGYEVIGPGNRNNDISGEEQ